MEPRRYLFVMWEGGGNVPLQLGVARKLVARGHQVCVLTEPAVRRDVLATGASYRWFTRAPHRQDRAREHDLVRDFDARTPIGTFAALRDRVMFGPARAYAQDTMAEIQRFRPHVLAVDWVLTGAAVAGEAADLPTALLMHGSNPVPEPGKPPPGFGFLPAKSPLGRARDRVFTWVFLRLFNKGLPALNDARLGRAMEPAVATGRPASACGGQHEHHLHAPGAGAAALRRRHRLDAGAGPRHRRTHAGSRRLPWRGQCGRGALGATRPSVPARQRRHHPRRHGNHHARPGPRSPAPLHAAGPRPKRRHHQGSLAWRRPAPGTARVRGQDPSGAGPRAARAVVPGSGPTTPAGDPGRPHGRPRHRRTRGPGPRALSAPTGPGPDPSRVMHRR